MPAENIVYFGDTARLPYGSKSPATVTTFVRQIIGYLAPLQPKHVVLACNTATALSLQAIRGEFPHLSISGVIEPGARAAVEAAGSKEQPVIGVIATEATVRSRAYERAIHRRRTQARLLQRPTPLLVPMIEEGRAHDDPLVRLALQQYLLPLVQRGIDVLVLGCTHYPLLADPIARVLGSRVRVIDSAAHCAEDVARRLRTAGLPRGDTEFHGSIRCFVTDDSPRFEQLASRFMGFAVARPTHVTPEELFAQSPGINPVRRAV
jgi:glutamate racemase